MDLMPYQPRTIQEYRLAMKNWLIGKNSKLTNFNVGSRIQTIIDSISYLLSQSDMETMLGFKTAITDGIYSLFGIETLPGKKAVGSLRIEIVDSEASLPLNLEIFTVTISGFEFVTENPISLGVNQGYVEVTCQATTEGIDGNIPSLFIDSMDGGANFSIPVPDGIRIYNPINFYGGEDEETNDAKHLRFQKFINSLNRSTLNAIRAAVLSIRGVYLCFIEDNVNPYTRQQENGWVNVFISDGTPAVSTSLSNEIYKILKGDTNDPINYPGYVSAGTQLYVGQLSIVPITIKLSVKVLSTTTLTDTQIQLQVFDSISRYINNLPNGYNVLVDTIKAFAIQSHPDIYKIEIESPTQDVIISNTQIPRVGGSFGGNVEFTSILKTKYE